MKNYLLIAALVASTIPNQTHASDFSKGVCIGVGITSVVALIGGYLYAERKSDFVEARAFHCISDNISGQEETPFEFTPRKSSTFYVRRIYDRVNELQRKINEQSHKIGELALANEQKDALIGVLNRSEGPYTDADRRAYMQWAAITPVGPEGARVILE